MTDEEANGNTPQIVICGSIAIDRIMNFKGHYQELIQPEKLHVLSVSMLLDKLEDSRGGIGANIAHGLAQLGEKPALVGSVGRDAELYVNDLTAIGIDTSHIHFSDLATASFNVITDSDDNQVGGFFQGAMSDSESISFRPWAGQNVLAVIAANNPKAMNRQIQECQELGFRMIYDPGQQVTDEATDLAAGVDAAEVVLVNDYELGILCRRLAVTSDELRQKVPLLITTFGKNGSVLESTRSPTPIQIGIAKGEAVDPTGAGDAYRAGFLYGYARNWDLKICGQLGATVASFIIERHGTQQEYTKNEIMHRYQENFNQEIKL